MTDAVIEDLVPRLAQETLRWAMEQIVNDPLLFGVQRLLPFPAPAEPEHDSLVRLGSDVDDCC